MAIEGVRRPAWAEVSSSAITDNARAMKTVAGAARLCAVVKADGYGHGALVAATAALAGGADYLAVALVDEGAELRAGGVTAPILLLAEIAPDSLPDALAHALTLTVGSLEGARAVARAAERHGGRSRVHLKIDTGMHRMGVAPEDVDVVVDVLIGCASLELEGVFTHFSVADGARGEDRSFTRAQYALFETVVSRLAARGIRPPLVHAANSAGTLGFPEAHGSMVRVGLALYGYLPDAWLGETLREHALTLRPAMSLVARVVATRRVGVGERPSYGRRRALERDATVATVPFGYADGYARRLFEGGAEVLIHGRRHPLAGAVTMDQLLIDVGDDDVAPGDEVVLLGVQGDERISADDWAAWSDTVPWEILTGVGARVPRRLVD